MLATPSGGWQGVYSRKLQRANDLYGRCSHDVLRGHQQSARCVALLPSAGLLASGACWASIKEKCFLGVKLLRERDGLLVD